MPSILHLRVGAIGTICEHSGLPNLQSGYFPEYCVKFDNDSVPGTRGVDGWQLEPISDSNTKISWSDMADLWTPAHLRETA